MFESRVPLTDEDRAARIAEVRARIEASGTVVSDWARERGFSVSMVHQVLAGRGKWKRGEAHRIAVALGLKQQAPPLSGDPEVKPASPDRLEGFRA